MEVGFDLRFELLSPTPPDTAGTIALPLIGPHGRGVEAKAGGTMISRTGAETCGSGRIM
jgi:hypothetical protein